MTDVVTFGEALVAIRAHGRLGQNARISASPAGAEMNVAIGLARLGHSVAWIGAVGDDSAGELILRELRAERVNVGAVRRDAAAPTGVMLVDMPAALPPSVTYHRRGSAGAGLTTDDVAKAGLDARILHVTGITPALSDSTRQAAECAIDAAREAGVIISFDVNYRAKLWSRDRAREVLTPFAASADIVIASEDELDLVADGTEESDRIAALLSERPREVIVKRGHRGASHTDTSGTTSRPAHVITVVNTIGAGDAFTAGYLSAFLDGLSVEERLDRGGLCGALAVSGVGDWEQAPTRFDLAVLQNANADTIR